MKIQLYKLYSTRLYMQLALFQKKLSLKKEVSLCTPLTPKFKKQRSLQNENPSNRTTDSSSS